MSRKTYEELNELKIKSNVDTLYSWSRYHKYKTSPYEYFLSYVKKPKTEPDRENSAYAPYGSISHDILERFYIKQINYEDMINEFKDGEVTLDIAELKFDRCNNDKN
ncbi:PD-(D/E)XK nuclease family protein, partial [Anaerosporobacter sp.]